MNYVDSKSNSKDQEHGNTMECFTKYVCKTKVHPVFYPFYNVKLKSLEASLRKT